jgi:hypothetical protein
MAKVFTDVSDRDVDFGKVTAELVVFSDLMRSHQSSEIPSEERRRHASEREKKYRQALTGRKRQSMSRLHFPDSSRVP